jgi:predicted thioesterase
MDDLKVGLKHTLAWTVEEKHCTSRGGEFRVFSTPSMVLLMELAAADLMKPYLAPGQNSVGTVVHLKHLAPTPLGHPVRAEVELVAIDRRRLAFKAAIFDDVEQVGEGEHERFIVDLDRYDARLRKKAGR